MSFSIYVQFHKKQGDKLVSRGELSKLFGKALKYENGEAWLTYADNEYPEMYGDFKQESINSFSVARPPVSESFWESLFAVLKIEGAVLLIPSLEGIVYANDATLNHIPLDMAGALPGHHRVGGHRKIIELIKHA